MMKNRIVVAELHILRPDRLSLIFRAQDFARLEYFGDEHRAFAFGRRRQKVQILPDRAADSARNADVMLETRPAARDRSLDELLHGRAAFRPQVADVAALAELEVTRGVSDDE